MYAVALRVVVVGTLVLVAGCSPGPAVGFDAEAFYSANCMDCHGGAEGGAMSDLPPRHNANGHTWHHGDCVLADIIRDGAGPRPGLPTEVPTMPAFDDQLDDGQIAALIEHMRAWWTPEQRSQQEATTRQVCG